MGGGDNFNTMGRTNILAWGGQTFSVDGEKEEDVSEAS